MMDPILGEFEDLVAGVPLSAPAIPFVATLTGEWANGDVTQAGYWSAQLRSTVRFADARARARRATKSAGRARTPIYLEVGPGNTLVTFAAETARGRRRLGRHA